MRCRWVTFIAQLSYASSGGPLTDTHPFRRTILSKQEKETKLVLELPAIVDCSPLHWHTGPECEKGISHQPFQKRGSALKFTYCELPLILGVHKTMPSSSRNFSPRWLLSLALPCRGTIVNQSECLQPKKRQSRSPLCTR